MVCAERKAPPIEKTTANVAEKTLGGMENLRTIEQLLDERAVNCRRAARRQNSKGIVQGPRY
jgi:hypothetical protein